MTEINPQQILIQQLNKVSNNKELIDLAVTLIESKQNIINYNYGSAYVLLDIETNTTFNDDEANFTDLLDHVARTNLDKINVTNACQYPDLTEGCVRYLHFKNVDVYYKIKITNIVYYYKLTKDQYIKTQRLFFEYTDRKIANQALDNGQFDVCKMLPSHVEGPELFTTELELLNKYPNALILT